MWQIIIAIGFLFLILEILTPALFFLNFAFAAFICAFISLFTKDITILVIVFCILSITMLYTLRPLFMSKKGNKKLETGMESKYINAVATVVEDTDKNSGAISIYDERWQARNLDEGIIEKGSRVKIESHESIIMYVRKVN